MEKCENCKFFHRLKHNFDRGKGFEESHCCTAWIEIEPTPDSWVQEVTPNEMCELFTEREF